MEVRHSKCFAIATIVLMSAAACAEADETDMARDTPPAATDTPVAGQQQAVNVPEGATAEQVSQGRQLFSGQGGCHACHGPQARGTQLAPDLTDGEWINIDDPNMQTVVELIRTGVPEPVEHPAPMPPMGGANLNDEQVQALAAYVLSINQG